MEIVFIPVGSSQTVSIVEDAPGSALVPGRYRK